jgi:hemerythrin-like domain-containing protein
MQARGLLMIEHRLIEKMIKLMTFTLKQIASEGKVDPFFIDTAVDFIRIYADRTHHGKEEDILFLALEKKNLSADDRRIMKELIDEHVLGRDTSKALVEATCRYGEVSALTDIARNLKILVDFYPVHIAKEDNVFFPASRSYFTDDEDQAMLAQFLEFDQKMIHEKYASVIKELEAKNS